MATTADEPLLVDTNILVEATDEARRHHRSARALIESHPSLVIPAQVIREYLVVATRPVIPASGGLGMSIEDAMENIRLFRSRLRLLPEEKPTLAALLRLLATVPCSGKKIHDANIVATAQVHGIAQIATLNTNDFRGFARQIKALTPDQCLR